MAATDSIYGCNRLYIWLQQTLYITATDSVYCKGDIPSTALTRTRAKATPLTQYMAATDSIYDFNCLYMAATDSIYCNWEVIMNPSTARPACVLQQTLCVAATDSIYGCNRLYMWLQLTLYTVKEKLSLTPPLHCLTYVPRQPYRLNICLQMTPYMASNDSIYGCNCLYMAATDSTYCNWEIIMNSSTALIRTCAKVTPLTQYMAATDSIYSCNWLPLNCSDSHIWQGNPNWL